MYPVESESADSGWPLRGTSATNYVVSIDFPAAYFHAPVVLQSVVPKSVPAESFNDEILFL